MSHINDTDRSEWAHHPVTREFIQTLSSSRLDAMEAWAKEAFVKESGELTLQANAKALGGIAVLDQVIESIEKLKLDVEVA